MELKTIRSLFGEQDAVEATVSHFHDIPELLGPDFVVVGITLNGVIHADNCVVVGDRKPRVGETVRLTASNGDDGFPRVEVVDSDDESASDE